MVRARFIPLLVGLASLGAFLAACNTPTTRQILAPIAESLEIYPNPVTAGDQSTFIISWRDAEGAMTKPQINILSTNTYSGQTMPIPVVDPQLIGNANAGTISFTVVAQAVYNGKITLTLVDDDGGVSNQIIQYFFVNTAPPDSSPE